MSDFSFNAYALGIGGQITSVDEVIPSAGSMVLSGSGGSGETLINDYSSPLGSITATKILSKVSGGRLGGNRFEAEASVIITGLKVRDLRRSIEIFTADFLSARVYSVHEKNGVLNPDSEITFQAQINGLRAADEDVDASLDTTLLDAGTTFNNFVTTFANNPAAKDYANHFGWNPAQFLNPAATGGAMVPVEFQNINTIPVSLLSRDAARGTKVTRNKFTVTIPGLAELHVGEAILKRGRRRMSLLRMELGSNSKDIGPPSGSVTFLSLEGNGTEIMP